MRTVQKGIIVIAAALTVAACSDNKSSPIRQVSAAGKTQGIVTDGATHVAYILNATPAYGSAGELHVADANGKDVKVDDGISSGAMLFSASGKGMIYVKKNASGDDAALNWIDPSNPAAPKVVVANGLQTQPINPGATTPTFTTPLTARNFVSPSGRFYVFGVAPPMVDQSQDLHVLDIDTGTEVFSRPNGAFDYLELVLPNDVMVFQDAVGGNGGIAGGGGLQTLFWVDLTSGSPTATMIATRTGAYAPTGDNKTIVYEDADARALFAWDAVAKPATGTKIASNALTFAAAANGPVAYLGTDGSMHVVGLDGTPVVDVAAAVAKADLESPVVISDDGADVYYFAAQTLSSQNSQGTLMHFAATAGATPAKIADTASPSDVHPLAGGVLLYLANVDAVGAFGDAFKSARDGSGATALGTHVPVGFLTVQTPVGMPGSATWFSAHLTMASENMNQRPSDLVRSLAGGLELTSPGGTATVDPAVRIGQYELSDDLQTLVWVGGSAFNAAVDNFVGNLEFAPAAMPAMKPAMPLLTGVTEIGPVVKRAMFVNAPAAATKPGVYFVSF